MPKNSSNPQTTLTYSSFLNQVDAGNIKTAAINADEVTGDFRQKYRTGGKSYTSYSTTTDTQLIDTLTPTLNKHGVDISFKSQTTPAWLALLGLLLQGLPFIFLIGLFYFGSRAARQQQQGIFGFGRSGGQALHGGAPQHHLRRCGRGGRGQAGAARRSSTS